MSIFEEVGHIVSGAIDGVEAVGHGIAAGYDAITGDSEGASAQLSEAGHDLDQGARDLFGDTAVDKVEGVATGLYHDVFGGDDNSSSEGDAGSQNPAYDSTQDSMYDSSAYDETGNETTAGEYAET